MTFRELVEGKLPTVKQVQNIIKKVDYMIIHPEFFSVEKKNTDAGMGGYDYIQITYDEKLAKSNKRVSDVQLGISAITKAFNVKSHKNGVMIIE